MKMKLVKDIDDLVSIMLILKVPCMKQYDTCIPCQTRKWMHCKSWEDVAIGSLKARQWQMALQSTTLYYSAVEAEKVNRKQHLENNDSV
jgi:hypothetical protein